MICIDLLLMMQRKKTRLFLHLHYYNDQSGTQNQYFPQT